MPVSGALQRLGQPQQLRGVDEALDEGDFLGAGDLQALALFHDVDELGGFQQRFVGAGVEPRIAAAEPLGMQLAAFEIPLVQIGDLELAAGRRFHSRTTSLTRSS